MTGDLHTSLWLILLFVLALPLAAFGVLQVFLRKRGGVYSGWGAVMVVLTAGVCALLMILYKIRV